MTFKERYQYNPKTDLIGRGGFSKVFKATDTLLDREVALKVFTTETSEKYDLVTEIKKVIRLDHPHLCRYFDVAFLENTNAFGEEEKVQIGVMEYLEAGDLKHYCQKNPALLNRLLLHVLQGLSFLHKRGIIHRDLKPQNILVTETEEGPVAKITDFGISKALDSGYHSSSMLMGTIEYMAPEQFNPDKYGIDAKIHTNLDLWSFGLMVYEIVQKENLFGGRSGGTSAEQVMSKILGDDYINKLEGLPEPYKKMVGACLVKDANQRARNADELIHILTNDTAIPDKPTPVYIEKEKPVETARPVAAVSEETIVLQKPSIAKPVEPIPVVDTPVKETETQKKLINNYSIYIGVIAVALTIILYFVTRPARAGDQALEDVSTDSAVESFYPSGVADSMAASQQDTAAAFDSRLIDSSSKQ